MAKDNIHETPTEKTPQSVGSKPVSPELKARQERVNAIAKELGASFPKDENGKTPPEVGQAIIAAAWAIERGELKQEDIAEIKSAAELKARVDSSKPVVEKQVSPKLLAAQKEANAIATEIAQALGIKKLSQELNASITSAAWLVQKKEVERDYFLKDLASVEDFAKRMEEHKAKKALEHPGYKPVEQVTEAQEHEAKKAPEHPSYKPDERVIEARESVAKMAKEIAMELTPEVDGVKKISPEANQQAMRAAWMIQKGEISHEDLMKDVKTVAELKSRLDDCKNPAKTQEISNEPER